MRCFDWLNKSLLVDSCDLCNNIPQDSYILWGWLAHICVSKPDRYWLKYWVIVWSSPRNYQNHRFFVIDSMKSALGIYQDMKKAYMKIYLMRPDSLGFCSLSYGTFSIKSRIGTKQCDFDFPLYDYFEVWQAPKHQWSCLVCQIIKWHAHLTTRLVEIKLRMSSFTVQWGVGLWMVRVVNLGH